MKLVFDREAKRQAMIDTIINDLAKQSGKEQSAFLIQEKPVNDNVEMNRIHSLNNRKRLAEIRFMLTEKPYNKIRELYEMIGEENE